MAEFVAVKDYALSLWSRAFELKLTHRSVLQKDKSQFVLVQNASLHEDLMRETNQVDINI